MHKPFDSLDIDENKKLNEIEKKFKYLTLQSDISSNKYDNNIKTEIKENDDERLKKSFNKVFNKNNNNYLEEDYIFTKEEIKKIYFINKNKSKVFDITKEKKENCKKGRLKIGDIPEYNVKHDKFGIDDIIQKIKTKIINGLFSLINKLNSEYDSEQKKKSEPLLTRINSEQYKVYSHKNNYEFLYANIGDFFSAETSKRNSTYPTDYNKKHIDLVKKENQKINVIKILNSSIKEMYEKYIHNEIPEFNLNNDLIELENKNGKEYREKYEKIALELIEFIDKKVKHYKN